MFEKPIRPRWWLLNLFVLVILGLLLVDEKSAISVSGHRLAETAIVIAGCAVLYLWLRSNAAAIAIEQWARSAHPRSRLSGRVTVYRSSAPAGDDGAQPPAAAAPSPHTAGTGRQQETDR